MVDPDLAQQFEPVRDQGESLIWAGKPHYVPFLASAVPALILGCLWGSMDLFFLVMSHRGQAHAAPGLNFFLVPFFMLHSLPFWGSLLYAAYLAGSYRNVAYAVTNRRLMIRSGFWGVGFESIDYDQVAEIDVSIGPIEKMIGAGTVRVDRGRRGSKGTVLYDRLIAIDSPYEVYKLIKQTSVDVKTDWDYPNKLRPSVNPGYQTEYKPQGPSG